MKKPKPVKARKYQSPTPPKSPPSEQTGLPWQILRTWWGLTLALLAALGALETPFTIFDFFRTIYSDTSPEITISADDPNPFILPFRVKNNSHFFSMDSVVWICGIDKITTPQGGLISGIGIMNKTAATTILPTHDTTFSCSIGADKSISAVINPVVRYKTMWFDREFANRKFTWYPQASPPRWIASD